MRNLGSARSLARRPLTVAAVVLPLGLAIGATTAIFSVADGVLLEPLPFPDPERIVLVLSSNPSLGLPRFSLSAPDLRDLREQNTSFDGLAGAATVGLHLSSGGETERLFGLRVTHEFFDVLAIEPLRGRRILEPDDRPGAAKVVVLSHGLWLRRFGGSDAALGKTVDLSGEPHEVIGVMPPDSYPLTRDVFVPAALDYAALPRGYRDLIGLGRLRADADAARAGADLAVVAARLAAAHADTNEGWTITVTGWKDQIVERVRPALWALLGAVGLVLVIATLDAVNLMLARQAARERELAVRRALGAGRCRMAGTFLAESLLLTLSAGAVGLLLAGPCTRGLLALYGDDLPRGANIGIDGSVLVFALALAVATGLVLGLVPALRSGRLDLQAALAEGGGHSAGRRSQKLGHGLVVVEVALSLVLLLGAGLLIRSFVRLASVDPGFAAEAALTGQTELPAWRYDGEGERRAFYRRLFEHLEALPGATAVAVASAPPISRFALVWTLQIEGRPPPRPGEEPLARSVNVSPGYFAVLGTPLLEGREFRSRDDENAPRVALVNRAAANRFWPGTSPVGRRLDIHYHESPEPIWWQVVGVVGDVHAHDLAEPPEPTVYTPLLQYPESRATLVARASGGPARVPPALADSLRGALAEVDPTLPLFEVRTLDELVEASVARPRLNAVVVGAFAALALLLAAIGVYGVLAHGVTLRRRELGIRQAVGADGASIQGLVLRRGMRPVALGLAAGVVAALATNRLLAGLLFGVGGGDPVSWAAAVGLPTVAGLLACWLPARQAVRTDPWTVLREE